MQNEQRNKRRIFEYKQRYKINNTSFELQRQNDIECFDKIMESHLNYLTIVYTYARKVRERLKIIFTAPKVKSILKGNFSHRMIFIMSL
jgi:hypothetical protein